MFEVPFQTDRSVPQLDSIEEGATVAPRLPNTPILSVACGLLAEPPLYAGGLVAEQDRLDTQWQLRLPDHNPLESDSPFSPDRFGNPPSDGRQALTLWLGGRDSLLPYPYHEARGGSANHPRTSVSPQIAATSVRDEPISDCLRPDN